MMHFSNRQWLYIALVLVLLAIGGVFSYWLYSTRTQVDLTTFLTATLSVLISMVALVIALQTYLSIDSVNNIAADPLKEMRDAIDARTTLNELIAEVSGDRPGTSVLHQHYLYQEEYARQLYAIYCLALEETATYRGLKVVDAEALRAASAPYLDRLQQKSRESLARLYTS